MHRRLISLFKGRTESTLLQLFRYTLVGGVAFAADYGALFLLKEYGDLHYLWAAALAFIVGLVTNYFLSVAWVFGKRSVQSRQTEFLIFALLGVLGLGINEVAMLALTSGVGLHYLISKLISTSVTYAWNFMSRKVLLFSISSEERATPPAPVAWQPTPQTQG